MPRSTDGHYESLLKESSNIIVLELDQNGYITFMNEFSKQIAGTDLLAKHICEFFVMNEKINLKELASQKAKSCLINLHSNLELSQTFYFDFMAVADKIVCVGQLCFSEYRVFKNHVMTLNSELNNLTRELQKSSSKIKFLSELKTKFLSYVSHDIRNPLTVISGYTDLILRNPKTSHDLQLISTRIKSSVEFILSLLNDLIDLVQIETGKIKLHFEQIDLGVYLRNLITEQEIISSQKNISIECEFPERLGTILIDKKRLQQILTNILSNAIKFSAEGTQVLFSVYHLKDSILFKVVDSGPGIPESKLEEIFDEFSLYRTKENSTSKGLGLTISKTLVKQHGGSIWVESIVGKGSSFFVKLPLKQVS